MSSLGLSWVGVIPLGQRHDGRTVAGKSAGEGHIALGGEILGSLQEVGEALGNTMRFFRTVLPMRTGDNSAA